VRAVAAWSCATRRPSDRDAARASTGPAISSAPAIARWIAATSALKSATADAYLDAIDAYRRGAGTLAARFAAAARRRAAATAICWRARRSRGYEVHGTDVSADAVERVVARLGAWYRDARHRRLRRRAGPLRRLRAVGT
jgi:hypothetical protein